jgi:hypothetical protein
VHVATTSFRGGLTEQARLADAGLACDHQRAAVAFGQAIESVADFPGLLVASDHHRGQEVGHGSEHATPTRQSRRVGAGAAASASGRLDHDAVAAVRVAAGQPVPRMERPAGLTEREAQCGPAPRGAQTKQVAAALGISVKTADLRGVETFELIAQA